MAAPEDSERLEIRERAFRLANELLVASIALVSDVCDPSLLSLSVHGVSMQQLVFPSVYCNLQEMSLFSDLLKHVIQRLKQILQRSLLRIRVNQSDRLLIPLSVSE